MFCSLRLTAPGQFLILEVLGEALEDFGTRQRSAIFILFFHLLDLGVPCLFGSVADDADDGLTALADVLERVLRQVWHARDAAIQRIEKLHDALDALVRRLDVVTLQNCT